MPKRSKLKRYRDTRPAIPLLNDEQAGWLRRLVDIPMRRDVESDPLPYGIATVFLNYQLIEPFTEFSHGPGIADAKWRCWRITEAGQEALRFARRHARKGTN